MQRLLNSELTRIAEARELSLLESPHEVLACLRPAWIEDSTTKLQGLPAKAATGIQHLLEEWSCILTAES